MKQFTLQVISQEKALLSETVDSITVPTTSGEVTVLAGHVPLFSRINSGVLTYRLDNSENFLVVSNGFLDVTSNGQVTVLVDSAVLDREISLQKAEAAILAANETMNKTTDQRELMMAEASLRQAMLELKIAQKTHKVKI